MNSIVTCTEVPTISVVIVATPNGSLVFPSAVSMVTFFGNGLIGIWSLSQQARAATLIPAPESNNPVTGVPLTRRARRAILVFRLRISNIFALRTRDCCTSLRNPGDTCNSCPTVMFASILFNSSIIEYGGLPRVSAIGARPDGPTSFIGSATARAGGSS